MSSHELCHSLSGKVPGDTFTPDIAARETDILEVCPAVPHLFVLVTDTTRTLLVLSIVTIVPIQ